MPTTSVLFLLSAAAALIEPDVDALIRLSDYPMRALESSQSAAAHIEVEIGANGRVTECRMLSSIGNESLAAKVCPIVARRKIKPAGMADGTESPARFTTLIRFFIPDAKGATEVARAVQPPDVELTANRLPGSEKMLDTAVVMAVGADGFPTDCKASRYAKDVRLVDVACAGLKAMKLNQMTETAGSPIPFVTIQRVRFVVKGSPAAITGPPAPSPPVP